MTNRRVLRHAEASLVRSCVILSSPETAAPLSLRDIPLTGGHPPSLLRYRQRSAPMQINSPAARRTAEVGGSNRINKTKTKRTPVWMSFCFGSPCWT